jgi:hypothetical protein
MIPADLPTTEESYSSALDSAHLEVLPTRCSVDYLIAAGWIADTLGTSLFRLRTEFDAIRGEHRQAADAARLATREYAGLVRRGAHAKAAELGDDAERSALTARALMLVHLKTLSEARERLFCFAVVKATKDKFMQDDEAVRGITAKSLELWLDPICPHCEGRGFTGGFSAPLAWCSQCDATGNRGKGRHGFRLARSEAGHAFGRSLLVAMDRKTEIVAVSMRRYLRQDRPAKPIGAAQAQALQDRLVDLRSAQAQED